ncbi:MAG: GFA family protein [Acidiferrobacterales bacterium]
MYHCHCSRCRRLHGTLFATFAYIQRDHFVIEHGTESLSWHFCRNCGCHLFAESDRKPGAMWYMPATLESEATPGHPKESEKHIFVASKSPCETITDDLPQYDEYAPPEVSPTS